MPVGILLSPSNGDREIFRLNLVSTIIPFFTITLPHSPPPPAAYFHSLFNPIRSEI